MKTIAELASLKSRVAVLTGGSGKLGRVMGRTLLELGAQVMLVDRDASGLEAAAAELDGGPRVQVLVTDLLDETSTRIVVPETLKRFGRIDVLINNAAFTGASGVKGFAVPLPEQSLEAWNAAMRVNVGAAFQLTQHAAEALTASRGVVVNVASIYGLVAPDFSLYEGTQMGNPAAYAASKAGLLQLTRYFATALAPRVRVNALTPGGIGRGQPETFVERYELRTPLGRMATEDDMQGALAFLASDLSAYVTGQNVVVDGGWTIW